MHRWLGFACLLVSCAAHAVIVRGTVTSPLGRPLPGARVQLIRLTEGPRNVADTISGVDGAYEIRTDLAGRFLLLTTPSPNATEYAPQIGSPFYGGRTDLVSTDIALDLSAITPQASVVATFLDTPLAQLSTEVEQVRPDELIPHAGVVPALRAMPGTFVVELGETGTPAGLYLRGADPAATKTMLDGVSADHLATRDAGQTFNLATLSSSGLSALTAPPSIELAPAANPMYFLGAEAGVLALATPRATSLHPELTYQGDAGSLDQVRNEAVGSVTHTRADVLGSFARYDTANSIPASPFHLVTWAANAGYQISSNTGLRVTFRDDVAASALASPYEFYAVEPEGRDAEQNLYATATFQTETARGWHNLVRFGLVRKRGETFNFFTPATGRAVTITGANGYAASGTAGFLQLPPREDLVTNRDEYSYETNAPLRHWLAGVLTVRFQDERGADLTAAGREQVGRRHISAAAGLQGELKHRFFYQASGFIDHSPLLGFRGAPRVGLTYVLVQPGARKFRGTSLHLTAAAGLREPTLLEQAAIQNTSGAVTTPRSRTLDLSVEQNILAQKLILGGTYFHNQFSHEPEPLGVSASPQTQLLGQTLAFRTQGLESGVRYQPFPRLFLLGGYTYLAALVEQSGARASFNPNLPGVAIGGVTAVAGARPFRRPPNTGFAAVEYTGRTLTATMKATFAGKSDDSTYLVQTPTLLLPNRNLSPGYTALDASLSYTVAHNITVFTQFLNLLDDRHIAPLGFLSTPFGVRAGLRIHFGGE